MAASTQQIVDSLKDAIYKLSSGVNQSVTFSGQTFTKKNLTELQQSLTFWEARLLRETAPTTPPFRRVQPTFIRVNG
jgi:hypothetical protein